MSERKILNPEEEPGKAKELLREGVEKLPIVPNDLLSVLECSIILASASVWE